MSQDLGGHDICTSTQGLDRSGQAGTPESPQTESLPETRTATVLKVRTTLLLGLPEPLSNTTIQHASP